MVLFDTAEIFAPMQIMMVLVIALIVFGPKRLPELGKSLGSALRDLNKAKNDMMKTFTLDHEPDHEPYKYDQYNSDNYSSSYQYDPTPSKPDLSDYTIAGVPPADLPAIEGTVSRDSHGSNGYDPGASADYMIASHKPAAASGGSSGSFDAELHTGAASGDHSADSPSKGEQNV
jgi:TatA/E family protein of Tat protein translocase